MSDTPKFVDVPFIGDVPRSFFWSVVALFALVMLALTARAAVFTYVDVHEFAYTFNAITGEAKPIQRNGYIATPPLLVSVYTIDKRPVQVCITADVSGSTLTPRTLNCKLVRFNPKGFDTWIEYQGSGSYNGAALEQTLKAYAYEDAGRDYSFLDEIIEMEAQSTAVASKSTELMQRQIQPKPEPIQTELEVDEPEEER